MGFMIISMIAAIGWQNAIGKNGALPWHIPEDLRYFKAMTLGKPVVMGRKTYESIGKPLPNRRNIVVTRNADWMADGVETAPSLEAALGLLRGTPEVMVIGGGALYNAALPAADRLYLTDVDQVVADADAFFPTINPEAWAETSRTHLDATDKRPALTFRVLDRI